MKTKLYFSGDGGTVERWMVVPTYDHCKRWGVGYSKHYCRSQTTRNAALFCGTRYVARPKNYLKKKLGLLEDTLKENSVDFGPRCL